MLCTCSPPGSRWARPRRRRWSRASSCSRTPRPTRALPGRAAPADFAAAATTPTGPRPRAAAGAGTRAAARIKTGSAVAGAAGTGAAPNCRSTTTWRRGLHRGSRYPRPSPRNLQRRRRARRDPGLLGSASTLLHLAPTVRPACATWESRSVGAREALERQWSRPMRRRTRGPILGPAGRSTPRATPSWPAGSRRRPPTCSPTTSPGRSDTTEPMAGRTMLWARGTRKP